MSLPSVAEVEHADWDSLKRIAEELGLNPKGRSGVVRMRVMDHVRRRSQPEPWRPSGVHLAPLLMRLGHPEEATRLWESAIRLEAPAPWVGYGAARLAAGELDEALKAYDRAAQMRDDVAFLHKAELLAARGDLLAAVEACNAYLDRKPDDLRALALKATFLAQGGSIDESITTLQGAAEAHPEIGAAWRGLGTLLLKAGRVEDAAHALRAATQNDEWDGDAWMSRGTALLLAGRTKDAIGALREALERDPNRPEALNDLGVAYLAAGSGKAALTHLERAARHLEFPQILLNLALARERAPRKTVARKTVERIVPRRKDAKAGRKRLPRRKARRKPPKKPSRGRKVVRRAKKTPKRVPKKRSRRP